MNVVSTTPLRRAVIIATVVAVAMTLAVAVTPRANAAAVSDTWSTSPAAPDTTARRSVTWTVGADTTRPNLTHGLAWSPSLALYVAVSNNGAYTSPDGTTWTLGTSLPASGWRGATWSPTLNLFVATNISGTNGIATSPDGLTWTATPTAITATLSAVT